MMEGDQKPIINKEKILLTDNDKRLSWGWFLGGKTKLVNPLFAFLSL